jgi:predicted alpha/beta hydrolase family esterase
MPKVERWSSTLRQDLGDAFEVFMPAMPNSQNAKYNEWKLWFERHFEYLDQELVLVGWSLGGYFLVKYLLEEEFPFSIKALVLLAAPFAEEALDGEDGGDFVFASERVSDLQNKLKNIVIMHSTDDFVVPYEHALKYAEALPQAELVTFEDRNHFLVPEFPELLAKIMSF